MNFPVRFILLLSSPLISSVATAQTVVKYISPSSSVPLGPLGSGDRPRRRSHPIPGQWERKNLLSERGMHPMKQFALLLVAAFSELAGASACQVESRDVELDQLKRTPLGQSVVVAGCYEATRHGISIQDCKEGLGSGLWLELSDELSRTRVAEEFRASAFRMPAVTNAPALHIRARGQRVSRDSHVAGGTIFQAVDLLCFDPLPLPASHPARKREGRRSRGAPAGA